MSDSLVIFCKKPEVGIVKSRLAKSIGDELAVDVYKKIITFILECVSYNNLEIFLYCYPNSNHPFFQDCRNSFKLNLFDQCGDNLGSRMYQAMHERLLSHDNVVLIGSDCPELDKHYIDSAFDSLRQRQNIVLGPVHDGGYALIGANKIDSKIFDSIQWSTNTVLEETKLRIRELGWNYVCLPYIRDIDTYDDYSYFSQHEKYKHIFD